MLGRLLLLGVFAVSLVGCATTSKTTMTQMEFRIAELERQVAEKDQEIEDLRDEVNQSSYQARRKATVEAEEATASTKRDGIIRVPVSAGQVQIALKKAGYYDGAIDSKIGSNTKVAIKKFQTDNGLHADGVIGKKTWDKLKTYLDEQ